MKLVKYTYLIYTCVSSLFINIAFTSALGRNPLSNSNNTLRVSGYHETPLHNLDDVADLSVDSSASPKDKLLELEEILEDESQSPDEQSVSKYEENVKVFDNPVVLEATSQPTEDEVKDFQKVREHELATEDRHYDSLENLVGGSHVLKLLGSKFLGKPTSNTVLSNGGNENQEQSVLNLGSTEGLGFKAISPKDLPPLTVKANSQNHFNILNVHHHHHGPADELDLNLEGVDVNLGGKYFNKECFEKSVNGTSGVKQCYCTKKPRCKCTKTFVMLVSVCDTLVNDSYLRDFCSHEDVKGDHPDLNHRFSKSFDKLVSEAHDTVHGGLCNPDLLKYCKYG